MDKVRTTIRIAGKDITMSSYSSEEQMQRVAAYVDKTMNDLTVATRLPLAQVSMLAAISIADDLIRARDDVQRLQRELDEAYIEMDAIRKAQEQ